MKLRSGVLLGSVALALALSGCGGGSSPSSSTSSPSTTSSGPSTSVTTGTATSTPTGPLTTPDENAVAVGRALSVDLPSGWQVLRSIQYDPSEGSLCLFPKGKAASVFGCSGIAIYYGKRLPGAHTDSYAPNLLDGWYPATDVQQCPFPPAKVGGHLNGIVTRAGLGKGLKPVGAHKAAWNRWNAGCDSGRTFHPQAWFLPKSHVVIFDYLEHPETAAVLASARFASDGDALPTMPDYVTGHLVSATSSSITLKVFRTYTTGPAGKAYAKAHGLEYPFPDDYYDADTGSTQTFPIGPDTACTGNNTLTGSSEDAPVACSKFAGHAGMPVGVWMAPEAPAADSVAEVFRP